MIVDTWEKTELTPSIRHIAISLKSGIPIYISEVPDTAGKNTRTRRRRRRTQVIAKRYAFHVNAKSFLPIEIIMVSNIYNIFILFK